eukprot:scaffold7789_cov200-Pinguiococcus_pyrenoidosus.AAC.1
MGDTKHTGSSTMDPTWCRRTSISSRSCGTGGRSFPVAIHRLERFRCLSHDASRLLADEADMTHPCRLAPAVSRTMMARTGRSKGSDLSRVPVPTPPQALLMWRGLSNSLMTSWASGNYDWWQFAWDNLLESGDLVEQYPSGFYVLNHFSGAVDPEGETLGFPPIHIHHVHGVPGKRNSMRADVSGCIIGRAECVGILAVVFEQHGDYECRKEDGGVRCLLEDLPDGYAKLVTTPMTINGELNDVRAPDSEVLEWYYQVAMRYIPKEPSEDPTNVKPLVDVADIK